jgi:heme exporter protein A
VRSSLWFCSSKESNLVSSAATDVRPLIRIEKLDKRYSHKRVLRDLSLQVNAGEVVALLGANGAGKTTLMRIVAGLEQPSRGEVWLGQVPLSRASHEIRRYVGLVGHAPLLYDNLSGLENLQFFARMYDIIEPATRIEAVLRSVDLWTRRYDAVRTYSRGMIQRLAIGRAILHDPPVLLLDEPDTGLDQVSARNLAELVTTLRRSRRAVLLTTHHLERAVDWADRLAFLADGEIVEELPTAELDHAQAREHYENWIG